MTHIEKLHLEAIDNNICSESNYSRILGKNEAASKSAEITEQISCEFVEWLTKIEAYPCINKEFNGLWVMHPQDPKNYTPKELFQEYLKSKENDKSN